MCVYKVTGNNDARACGAWSMPCCTLPAPSRDQGEEEDTAPILEGSASAGVAGAAGPPIAITLISTTKDRDQNIILPAVLLSKLKIWKATHRLGARWGVMKPHLHVSRVPECHDSSFFLPTKWSHGLALQQICLLDEFQIN